MDRRPIAEFVELLRLNDIAVVADVRRFPRSRWHPQFNEGLGLTLPDVVQYLPDVVTPPKLAAMDAELKAIP